MHRIDADAHVANLFSDGDTGTGQPGTKVDAAWLNAVQEEVCHFVEEMGITLNKADRTQLAQAVAANFPAPTWSPLAAGTNWTAGGGAFSPDYWKDRAGMVHLRGSLVGGTSPATVMFSTDLPAGCRPARPTFLPCWDSTASAFIVVLVDTDGRIFWNGSPPNAHTVYLDSIAFLAEQ